jgi:hypothetical protein
MRTARAQGALVALALLLIAAPAAAQPVQRVRPDAREILAYRMTLDGFRRFTRVTDLMDGVRVPQVPGAVRSDSAFFVVLSMGFAHRTPWTDQDVADNAARIEAGHHELAQAIRSAGLTSREYILIQMTLLLAHPTIARKKHGIADPPPTDVAMPNLDFVEANWREVDAYMTRVQVRIAQERQGQ